MTIDARTLARISVVQAIYEQEIAGGYDLDNKDDLQKKIEALSEKNDFKRINKKLFEQILDIVSRETLIINEKIKSNLAQNWSMERIGAVIRAILSAAIAESMLEEPTDKKIIISEYVRIASGFYDDKEVKFVNAILDKIL